MKTASITFEDNDVIGESILSKSSGKTSWNISGIRMRFGQIRLLAHIMFRIMKRTKSPSKFFQTFKQIRAIRKVNMGNVRLRKYVKAGRQLSWSMYSPPFPSKEFDNLINLELDYLLGENGVDSPLHFIFLSITKSCPLQCEHCLEWDIMHQKEKLSLPDLKSIVQKFQERNISSVFLTGGEPLSRYDDLLELIKFGSKKCKIWVFTSGYSLTLKKAHELKNAGLQGVLISIDHYKEEEHNTFRGSPHSFQKAIQAVRNANDAGLITAVSICVTKSFISEENLNNYMEFAKNLNVAFVQFFEPKKEGNYKDKDVLLSPKQLHLLENFFRTFNDSVANYAYPLIIYHGYHQRKNGCHGAGKRYLYVDSNGDIQACPFCPNKMGSALDENLSFMQGVCKTYVISKN